MSESTIPVPPTDFAPSDDFLPALLDLLPTGVIGYAPVIDESGAVIDFTFAYLNPAAQRILTLPARPTTTFTQQFPTTRLNGSLDFHRAAYQSGETGHFELNYQADGYDNYFRIAARRLGDKLLVTFTDTADQPRSVVEEALRESQAREKAARAQAERERNQWEALVNQAPVAIGLFAGPDLHITAANQLMSSIWGYEQAEVLNRPLLEAVPDLQGQGFDELIRQVYETRIPLVGTEVAALLPRNGQLTTAYYNFVYQPLYDAQGEILGVLDVALDVTEQVLARRKLEQFNQELEARVAERTQALHQAQVAAEQEREQLYQVFEQTPVAIAIMRGPNLRVELANPAVAAIWGREPAQVLGRPYFEAVPDTAGQGFEQILSDVLTTGEPFTITDAPVTLARAHRGLPTQAYVNFVFQPLHDADGKTVGIIASGLEVTEQVLARQQVQQFNQELTASNEALEARVLARTREAQLAQTQAERQRGELQRVFEQAPIAIAVYRGPNYIIELANSTVCQLWGRTAEQIVGKGLFEALPEVAGMGYEELLDEVMATGKPHVSHAMEAVHEREGRRDTVYWDFVYVPTYEDDGSISGVMVVANEVTEQVLARRKVEELNQGLEAQVLARTHQVKQQSLRLERLIQEAPAAIATLHGPELAFELLNEDYQALFPNRVLRGKPVMEALPELVGSGLDTVLREVYETGVSFEGREVLIPFARPGDGLLEDRYFDFIYQARYDAEGAIDGLVLFGFEVTDKVLARKQTDTMQAAMLAVAQRRAQERQDLLSLFERAPVAVALLREPDHRIEYYNTFFRQLYPAKELRGLTMAKAYPGPVMAVIIGHLDEVYETGETYHSAEIPLADAPDKAPRYITSIYQAYRENDRIAGVAMFIHDVTEQVLARQQVQSLNEELAAINEEMQATNEELRDSNNRLTRTNADLDTFVYSASHDLKSPITNIEGLLLALRQQLPAAAMQAELVPRILTMMDSAVTRFQQTLGYLTDVSRLQQVLFDQTAEAVDLPALVESVRLDILPELTAAEATLTLDLGGCSTLYFPIKNLRSILYNLLSNAIKYRDPARPAQIALRCHRSTAGQFALEVQDNGLGLSTAQQNELFRLFRRLHSHVEGSGVGLYMVKKMVENAGGTLVVQSQLGVGTTFTVTLPASNQP